MPAEDDVDVLRLEAEPQACVRACDDLLGADAPAAVVRERVLRDRRGEVVGVLDVRDRARARRSSQPCVAEVALGRQQAGRRHVGELPRVRAVVAEQPADQRLGLRVLALAEVRVANVALLVDQVLGRPVLVRVVVPGLVVVVLHDRVGDARAASTAARTFDVTCSNANSGVCTPMITSPSSWYAAYHALRCGSVRRQLMQEYVQKSTSTTLPRSCCERQRLRVDPGTVGWSGGATP